MCAKLSAMFAHSRYMCGRRESLMRQIPDDDILRFECFCDDLESCAAKTETQGDQQRGHEQTRRKLAPQLSCVSVDSILGVSEIVGGV